MAISSEATILEHNLFKQRDGRDVLGIWNLTHDITGDATGGSIKLAILPNSPDRIFNVVALGLSVSQLVASAIGKFRYLCNFPPASVTQGRDSTDFTRSFTISQSADLTTPGDNWAAGNNQDPGWDKLLLWGSALPGVISAILELESGDNTLNETYFFDAWGYFWDRNVMYEPGGPRFPGAS